MSEYFAHRDRLVGGISADGFYSYSVIQATNTVESARKRHGLAPPAAMILGELLIGSALAASKVKGEERIILRLEGDGPLKMAVAESNGAGEIRGYVNNPIAVAKGATLAEALANTLGNGTLSYTRIIEGVEHPMQSFVPIKAGRVVKDLAYYFAFSEQVPSALRIKVTLNKDDRVEFAWGLLIQAMPGATEDMTAQIETQVKNLDVSKINWDEHFTENVAQQAFGSMELKELRRYPVDFYCRCSSRRFEKALLMLGPAELIDMAEQGTQELVCHYCNEKYYFNPDALKKLSDYFDEKDN